MVSIGFEPMLKTIQTILAKLRIKPVSAMKPRNNFIPIKWIEHLLFNLQN